MLWVMIIGQPGSGKSWLAREMGQRSGPPDFHMDRHRLTTRTEVAMFLTRLPGLTS